MKNTTLGITDIFVSPLTIGAWQLGGPLFFDGKPDGHPDPGKENVIRMIRELGDLGINSIDTAEQYSAGEAERRVGEAIAGHRDEWVISTKFGYRVGPGGTRIDDSSPPTILSSLEGSLKRLGTDYIDVYLYHCAPTVAELEEGKAILEQAKAAGKIRAYGISGNDLELFSKMAELEMLDVLQFANSLLDPQDELWNLCRAQGIGTQLRGVMAQGRLSGKYFSGAPAFRADDNRSQWCVDEDYTRFAALAEVLPEGMSMAQAAIRWMLDRPGAHTICMGAKNLDDYKSAIAAADMPSLSEDVRLRLEAMAQEL